MRKSKPRLDIESAEAIALRGLAFLAEDRARLGRFLSLTGMGPNELRAATASRAMAVAVLDYLLGDESLLLVFAAHAGVAPETIAPARDLLVATMPESGEP